MLVSYLNVNVVDISMLGDREQERAKIDRYLDMHKSDDTPFY